jgi:large subunit ribosomal protein L21
VYAIIRSGGHQVRVKAGDVVTVEGRLGEPGEEVALDDVLLVSKDSGEFVAGSPFVANARVLGIVDGPASGPKIRVFRKKRRKGMRRTQGHRSQLTRIRIKEITF